MTASHRQGSLGVLRRGPLERAAPAIVTGAILVGAGLRLYGLTDHTISHNEIYVPGIELPDELANPQSRHTFFKTITSTIAVESHPPGYYLLMLGWTKCFGTSLFSIRLPSVLFDTATIGLIYWLGIRAGLLEASVLASVLWAGGGLPVFQAQDARMYPLACLAGVLSTALLIESYRLTRARQLAIVAYLCVTLAGVASSLFYWPIVLAQMLYAGLWPAAVSGRIAPQVRWQLLAIAAGSPLLAIAAFQSGRRSYLPADPGGHVLDYLNLLYAWIPPAAGWPPLLGSATTASVTLLCLLLVGVALARLHSSSQAVLPELIEPPAGLVYASALAAGAAIVAFGLVTDRMRFDWLEKRTTAVLACGLVPLGAAVADVLGRRGWAHRAAIHSGGRLLTSPATLIASLALLPMAFLAGVTLLVPVLAQRVGYLYGPFLILLICAGAMSFSRRASWKAALAGVLLLVNLAGLRQHRARHHSARDYAGLAAAVAPEARPEDLWFLVRHWALTPLFYYMTPQTHHFVGTEHTQALSEHPAARVWVLGAPVAEPPQRVLEPLRAYQRARRIEARGGIYAELYLPPKPGATDG